MTEPRIAVLLSCMHQDDASIVSQSAIQTDVVVVNQCDHDAEQHTVFANDRGQECTLSFVSTTTRGLSRSRNMCIDHCRADVCILSDDDETFVAGYADIVARAYGQYPDADVIAFQVENTGKTYRAEPARVGRLGALRIQSPEITFRRRPVVEKGIRFDEQMGSGTGHGGGEENSFLYQCLRQGLCVRYVPAVISRLNLTSGSQWFQGFTPQFFFNRGWATARYMGRPAALAYAFYYTLRKRPMYRHETSMWKAFISTVRGVFADRHEPSRTASRKCDSGRA